MNRKATLLVLTVFVLGLALGGLGMHLAGDLFGVGASGRKDTRMVDELTRELSLTADQQKQLASILADSRTKYHAIYEQYRPRMDEVRQQGRTNIRGILSAEQMPKFEAWLQRVDENRKRKNSGR